MELYEALYTTRAMRRLKTDPIQRDVQARILDAAIRAPSGSNAQRWRFLLVDDPEVIGQLAPHYRECVQELWSMPSYAERIAAARANPDIAQNRESTRLIDSAQHLADQFHEIPLLLFAFAQADTSGSSIFPSVWSAQLAARAEGVGSCLTTILSFHRDAVFELLGAPLDEGWEMTCCVTFGYPTGRWGVAKRRPAHEVAFQNRWGEPLPYEIPEPLWTGESK